MEEKTPNESLRCMEVWGGNRGIEQSFELPGLDAWLYSRPIANAENGGDVYYLSSCASGRISRLLLADVSGHGPEVSKLALRLRELMRRNINRISQARLVANMNQEFISFNQESRFATALVGTYFSNTGSFQLCTAGHPQPFIFRAKNSTWDLLDLNRHPSSAGNIPLGILQEVEYGQIELPLDPGDMIFAYTDGMIEAHVSDGTLLGTTGLLALLQAIDPAKPSEIVKKLVARLLAIATDPIEDDFTALLVRSNTRHIKFVDNLLAPFRLLRQPLVSTSFRDNITQEQS